MVQHRLHALREGDAVLMCFEGAVVFFIKQGNKSAAELPTESSDGLARIFVKLQYIDQVYYGGDYHIFST